MGIISRGRCCGRNIVFDVVTGSDEPVEPGLMRLVFDDFASSGVTDPSDVAEWNSVYGWSFDSVVVTDTATVELYGTNFGNETIAASQFELNPGILEIYDEGGFIGTLGQYCFDQSGITYVSMPALETVTDFSFNLCVSLLEVNMPAVTEVSTGAFFGASNFSTYTFGNVVTIGEVAFIATAIVNANFPSCTTVGGSAFNSCSFLSTANFPLLTTMGESVFYTCVSILSGDDINIPLITSLPTRTFAFCSSMTYYDGTGVTSVGFECFRGCTALITTNFPDAVTLDDQAFYVCSNLVNYDFSSAETIGVSCITGTLITTIDLPSAITVDDGAVNNNPSVTIADMPLCTSIGILCFLNNTALVEINLPACVDMGSGSGDCFDGISGNTIDATFNTVLQTNNGGNQDASIQDLVANNTVTITWV